MPFEKQIQRLLDVISQKQTNKKKHMNKTQHRRNLSAACQSAEEQRAHVALVKWESHRSELLRLSCSLLVWFPVRVVNFRLHAVHALRPLSIDHSPLLLTESPAEDKTFTWDVFFFFLNSGVTRLALTSCPGCDLPPCAALFQTCHKIWSSTHTYRQCWWRTSQNKYQNSMLQTLWHPNK